MPRKRKQTNKTKLNKNGVEIGWWGAGRVDWDFIYFLFAHHFWPSLNPALFVVVERDGEVVALDGQPVFWHRWLLAVPLQVFIRCLFFLSLSPSTSLFIILRTLLFLDGVLTNALMDSFANRSRTHTGRSSLDLSLDDIEFLFVCICW